MPSPPVLSVPLPSTSPQKAFDFATSPSQFKFGLERSSHNNPRTWTLDGARQKRARAHTTPSTKENQYNDVFGDSLISRVAESDNLDDDSNPAEYNIRTALAFERLRRTTYDQGEVFVDRMREWEESKGLSSRGDGPVDSGISVDAGSTSMSNSVTSTSTLSSASGSEASISGSSGRKRSWSIVEDEAESTNAAGSEMEWEVLPPAISGASNHSADQKERKLVHIFDTPESEDQDGDDEQEEDASEEDSDDDLVFVINNPPSEGPRPDPALTRPISIPTVTPSTNTERMLAELSQVLAAGAGSLDDFTVRLPDGERPLPDGGALWQ